MNELKKKCLSMKSLYLSCFGRQEIRDDDCKSVWKINIFLSWVCVCLYETHEKFTKK